MHSISITLEEQTRRKTEAKKAAKALKANIAKADRIYKKLGLERDDRGWWIAGYLFHKHTDPAPLSILTAVIDIWITAKTIGQRELRKHLKSILED